VLRRDDTLELNEQLVCQLCRHQRLALVLRAGWATPSALLPAQVARTSHSTGPLAALRGAQAGSTVSMAGFGVNHVFLLGMRKPPPPAQATEASRLVSLLATGISGER
jgi:hypothetical protein